MMRFLLEWVVTASLLILAVIALRALLGRRISAGLRYALWTVVLIRLLVPLQFFSLPVPAVFPEADREPITTSAAPAATVPVLQGEPVGVPAIAAPQPNGVVVSHNATITPSAVTLDVTHLWDVLGWLWLAGTGVMAAMFLISNLIFALRLRRIRVPLEVADCSLPVYLAENLPSPCLFGLVRPGVYVTAETAQDPAMLRHILAHEHTHFRHGDHVWNVLRSVALAVHWWNPLVWLSVVLSRRDCELACDEGALKRLGDGERIAYGRTLLALITVKPRPGDLLRCATTMTGGQKSVFDRVTRIARTPKRWLWAAVAAVVITALACVCAFGQAEETEPEGEVDPKESDSASFDSLDADLAFSIDENGNVAITGTIDNLTLGAGTCWQSTGAPAHTLMMPYAPFDDGDVDGCLQAQWDGDDTVLMWSQIMTSPSSDANAGFWIFSVDLSGEQAVVTDMASLPSSPAKTDSDSTLRLHPKSISDEEAVRAARIAAKLMTAAEDYYNNNYNSAPEDIYAALPDLYAKVLRGESKFVLHKNEPPISISEVPAIIDPYDSYMCLQRYAVVDLLGGLGSNETPNVLAYFGGVAGDLAGYLLLWDEDGEVHGEIFDRHGWRNRWFIDLKTDGTFVCTDALGGHYWSSISYLRPTAAGGWSLYSEAVHRNLDDSGQEIDLESFMVINRELDEKEFEQALEAQWAKPDVTWYELPLKGFDGGPVPTQPIAPIDLPNLDGLTFSDGWNNSVNIDGVDVQEMYWYSPSQQHYPQGWLFFTNPAFLGSAFAGRQIQGSIGWADDSHTQMDGYLTVEDHPYLRFTIEMDEGRVTPSFTGLGFSDHEMIVMAQTCAVLMEQAEAYKTSGAYRPVEEGPPAL